MCSMRLNPGMTFGLDDIRHDFWANDEAKLLPLNVFQYVLDKTELFGLQFIEFFSR